MVPKANRTQNLQFYRHLAQIVGQGISPSQGLYAGQHKENTQTYPHPHPMWDSNL